MKTQPRSVVLIAFAAIIGLLACDLGSSAQGGGAPSTESAATTEDSTAATPSAEQGGPVPICSLMTNEEASAILGADTTGIPREGGEPGRSFINCEFAAGPQSLTVQGGSAEQAKELLMAATYNMQQMQADPDEQAVIDDTAANLLSLTYQQVADRIFPMYDTHCFVVSPLDTVGDAGRWITCSRLQYTAVAGHRGSAEEEMVFVDVVWLGSSLDEEAQKALLITAVNTGLSRLPLGSTVVIGN